MKFCQKFKFRPTCPPPRPPECPHRERELMRIKSSHRGAVKLDSMWQHRLTRPLHVSSYTAYVLPYNLQTKSI